VIVNSYVVFVIGSEYNVNKKCAAVYYCVAEYWKLPHFCISGVQWRSWVNPWGVVWQRSGIGLTMNDGNEMLTDGNSGGRREG